MAFAIDSHLEDHSKLTFHFMTDPGSESTSDSADRGKPIERELPFFENINIEESVSTNYSEYTPIGSNGSMFAYLGTKSRDLNLSFNLTLPHIMRYSFIKLTAQPKPKTEVTEEDYQAPKDSKENKNSTNSYGDFISHFDRRFFDKLTDEEKRFLPIKYPRFNSLLAESGLSQAGGLEPTVNERRARASINMAYIMNLIRSSLITHSMTPWTGPPILRLKHGMLYQDVPCICQSYNISYDEAAGYDPVLMVPRVLTVKMSLKEVRLRGSAFIPGNTKFSDFQKGWDTFFERNKDRYTIGDPFDENRIIITREE